MLGVCLGHQVIVEALGGQILVSDRPMHGKSCLIYHAENSRLFGNISNPFRAGRYHSLLADRETMPDQLKVIATSDDGFIMAVEHVSLPVFGVQFHPESVLTEQGYQLLFNFLSIANANPVSNSSQRIFA
jgi:anthranilate synthase/aminodeoxychorismate synthase-like glutamine amidotransferase